VELDVTPLLTSAGVAGTIVGLVARDTLARRPVLGGRRDGAAVA